MTRAQFRQQISNSFDIEELKTLCFDLELDYDTISGENKDAKIRELIKLMQRKDRMPQLVLQLKKSRPNKNWEEILQTNQVYDSITKRKPLIFILFIFLISILVVLGINYSLNQPTSNQNLLLAASFEKPIVISSSSPTPDKVSEQPTSTSTSTITPSPTASKTPTPTVTPTASAMPAPHAKVVGDSAFRLGPGEAYGSTFPTLKENEIILILGRTIDSFWFNIVRDDESQSTGWVGERRVELLDGWEVTAVPIVQTIPPLPTIQPDPTQESATATPPSNNNGGSEDNNDPPSGGDEPTREVNP